MKKFPYLLVVAFLFLFVACSDETTIYENPQEAIQLESSQTVLDNSVSLENAGVLDIFEEQELNSGFSRSADEQAGEYPLTLVAQISAPEYSGVDLTASHVHLDGDYAYVSYNTAGDVYAGGIDIVYIADPNNPRLTGRLYYTNADLSSIKYDNGFVYTVGGVDSEKSVTATSNAFVAKIAVSDGRFNLGTGITYGFQEGFVATDVETTANTVLVTSGKDGFVTRYDKTTMAAIDDTPFADLRSLELKDDKIGVLDADFGVRVLDQSLAQVAGIPIDADFRSADKRTMAFALDKIIVAEGGAGAGVYDFATGNFLEHVPILVNPSGVEQSDIVTNAVSMNEDVMLMANGGAGLCLSDNLATATNVVGIIELSGSINYVETKGDYIFAASGREGLQIIKMNKPDASLEARCADSPRYKGSSGLNVPAGSALAYSGSARFRSVDVAGSLLLCGTWTVRNEVDIHDGGLFEMNGTFIVARNNKRKDLTVGEGATFRVEGDLTVYGDLILEDDATLEFIGDGSVVNIFGDVVRGDNTNVSGNFNDVQDKF